MSRRPHDIVNRGDEARHAYSGSYVHDAQRCRHPHKKLLPDGNSYWCEPCRRIVGFLRLPTKGVPT